MATCELVTKEKDKALKTVDELKSTNNELQESIKELQKENVVLKDQYTEMEKKRDRWKHEKELLEQENSDKAGDIKKKAFPSNETIIHNLLTTQVEFYFSDHHLKRDKPLMEKLTSRDDGTDQGFIGFDEVTQFPKVRTLGQDKDVVLKAVRASKYLQIKEEDNGKILVGRTQFTPPTPQQFPFRRTVFVYGIPMEKDEYWIRNNFECFGKITKVKWDHGPHSIPRRVGAQLLRKEPSRVIRLHIRDSNHTEFEFRKSHNAEIPDYNCGVCQRLKKFSEGYYISTDRNLPVNFPYMFCIQCAAKQAEENLNFFKSRSSPLYRDENNVKELFGIDVKMYSDDPEDLNVFKTCLIVFESQRQASKCVYVRSRLGIMGCFCNPLP
eukprot:UN24917